MTEKQIDAAFNSSRNLFLTGPAGTGKSYTLNKYIESHENILMCAPTGIAALNIGGDTMHRLFHIPVPAYESPSFAKNKKGAITQSMLKVIAQADTIIIDEISMARNDVFSFAIKVIRKAEKLKGSKIRLIVCGDFSQLPPVVKKTEHALMKKFGFDLSGYAFTTPEWKSCNFKVVELTEVKRQSDLEFITELNKIRVGNFETLDYWKQFVNKNTDYKNSVVICGTNAEADRINKEYLDSLDGEIKVLQSFKEGYCTSGYIDDIILVKEGCRIIFNANDNIKKKYSNGTFGTLKRIDVNYVIVDIDGEDVVVKKHDYPIYSYTCTKNVLTKKELGVIHQYPFKLGKAITIHKSQGQTFDNVIISPEIFAAGQLYVALSRVRSPQGFVLLDELKPEYLIIDDNVKKFYAGNYTFDVKKKTTGRKPTVKVSKRTKSSKQSKSKTTVKSSKLKTTRKSVNRKSSTSIRKKSTGSKK